MYPAYICIFLHESAGDYITLRFGACARRVLLGLRTNLVTVNGSLKHHNTTSTKRTKKNAGIERSKKKKKQNKPATGGKKKKIVSR